MRGEIEQIIADEVLAGVRQHHRLDQRAQLSAQEILASTRTRSAEFCGRVCRLSSWKRCRCHGPSSARLSAGIPELVANGENGWLVPAGDLKQLVDAMATCANASSTALETMGRLSRQKVLQMHDIDIEVQKLRTLFGGQIDRVVVD